MKLEQMELWELLPGAAGGQALRQRKDHDYFAQLGARGGAATRERYGVDYLKALAQRGGEATRQRYHATPQTMHPWYGGVERRIPYWPPTIDQAAQAAPLRSGRTGGCPRVSADQCSRREPDVAAGLCPRQSHSRTCDLRYRRGRTIRDY